MTMSGMVWMGREMVEMVIRCKMKNKVMVMVRGEVGRMINS